MTAGKLWTRSNDTVWAITGYTHNGEIIYTVNDVCYALIVKQQDLANKKMRKRNPYNCAKELALSSPALAAKSNVTSHHQKGRANAKRNDECEY